MPCYDPLPAGILLTHRKIVAGISARADLFGQIVFIFVLY